MERTSEMEITVRVSGYFRFSVATYKTLTSGLELRFGGKRFATAIRLSSSSGAISIVGERITGGLWAGTLPLKFSFGSITGVLMDGVNRVR